LDRSGSMASLGTNPPEPLTSVKFAASSFINELKPGDDIGVVSFATSATNPPDMILTKDFTQAQNAVDKVSIEPGSTQYTNIYDAIHSAWGELVSGRSEQNASKVAVLLTDGEATYPRDPVGKTEEDDILYAEKTALTEATSAKRDGILIYTIGLGDSINESFLKQIASAEQNYFFAPRAADLLQIYKNISTDICKEVPARIEITYKIFN